MPFQDRQEDTSLLVQLRTRHSWRVVRGHAKGGSEGAQRPAHAGSAAQRLGAQRRSQAAHAHRHGEEWIEGPAIALEKSTVSVMLARGESFVEGNYYEVQ